MPWQGSFLCNVLLGRPRFPNRGTIAVQRPPWPTSVWATVGQAVLMDNRGTIAVPPCEIAMFCQANASHKQNKFAEGLWQHNIGEFSDAALPEPNRKLDMTAAREGLAKHSDLTQHSTFTRLDFMLEVIRARDLRCGRVVGPHLPQKKAQG